MKTPTASNDRRHRKRRAGPLSTRDLLICAVLGGLTAMATVALASAMATIATLSPPLYALVAGYTAIAPLLALRIVRRPGAAMVTALCCAIIAWPFNALGVLLLVALLAPALAMDAVYALRGRLGERAALWAGAGAAAVVIFALSLPVISPEQLTLTLVVLTLIGRLTSYAIACAVSGAIARALRRAGVRV